MDVCGPCAICVLMPKIHDCNHIHIADVTGRIRGNV